MLLAYQFGIRFDRSAIQVIMPQPGTSPNFSTDNFGLNHAANGRLRTLWYQSDASTYDFGSAGTVAFSFRCTALKSIPNLNQILSIEPTEFDNVFYNEEGEEVPAQIKVQASVLQSGQVDSTKTLLYPGVFNEQLFLQINSESASTIQVHLSDFFGHMVSHTFEIVQGLNHISLENLASNLKPGLIGYQILKESQILSGKLVKQSSN